MMLRNTSFAIGIGSTAPSSHADCAPWAHCAPWASGDKPTAPASPWQNGFAERLIGSIRRECKKQEARLDRPLLAGLAIAQGDRVQNLIAMQGNNFGFGV